MAEQTGDKTGERGTYGTLGYIFGYSLGRYDKAIKYFEMYLTVNKQSGDRAGERDANGNIGFCYRSLGQYNKAIQYYERYLAIAKQIGDKIDEQSAYDNIGQCYRSLTLYNKAIQSYESVLTIAKQTGDKEFERSAYGNLGFCCYNLGQYNKAVQYYEMYSTIAKQIGDKASEGEAYGNLGRCYSSLGQYDEAIQHQETLLTIAQQTGDKSGENIAHNSLGCAYRSLGQYDKAIQHHETCLKMVEQIGCKDGEGIAYCGLGNCYHSLGQYDKAIKYHKMHLTIAKQIGNKTGEKSAYGNLGKSYVYLEEYEKAIEYFEMCFAITKEIGDKASEVKAYGNLGNCYHVRRQYDKAIKYHEIELTIAKQIGDKASEGVAYSHLGNSYASLEQYDKAVKNYELSLSTAQQVRDKAWERDVYFNLGSCFFNTKRYKQAEQNFRQSLSSSEWLSSNVPKQDAFKISFRNTFHFTLPHRFLIQSLLFQNRTDDALVVEERLRSRALVELMQTSYAVSCVETSAAKLNSLIEIFDVVKALDCSVLYLSYDENAEEVLMWVIHPSGNVSFERKKDVVKKALDCIILIAKRIPDTLTYEDRSLSFLYPELESKPEVQDTSFAVSDDQTKTEETVSNETYSISRIIKDKREAMPPSPTVRKTMSATIGPAPSEFNDCFKRLYETVLSPVRELIKGTQVVVVPDQELYLVPFAALQDDEGRYVAEYLKIRLVPSLATAKMFTKHSQLSSDSGGSPLIIGNPDIGNPDKRLPWAQKEAIAIGRLLGARPLTGREATKEKVLQYLENSDLIHIAAHGDMERGDILLASTNNGVNRKKKECVLSMSDLEGKCLKAKLVVLSCCHSGGGKVTAEGVIGIARSFLGAGARAVLVALWALHDEATMFFMESFYEHLSLGKKANESLYQTMKTMREKQEFNDPFFWAPFVLIGDDVTVFETS